MNALHVLDAPARAIATIAINALWEDAIIVLAVALLLRLWPRLNAATRYTAWFLALIAALGAPVATTLSVRYVIPSPSTALRALRVNRVEGPTRSIAALPRLRASGASPMTTQRAEPILSARSAVEGLGVTRPQIALPTDAAIAIALLWVLAALVILVRLVAGLVKLESLKHNALPLPLEYRDALLRFRADSHGRDVRFCVSDETEVPVAVGLFDSMILIPRCLLDSLSQEELEQVCLHERGHLRRADDWTNLLQRVLVALLCLSPAVYAIARGLDLEREVACDDDVVTETGAVRPYAQCLTRMAEVTAWPHRALAAPGVFVTRRGISERIERLLRAGRNATRGLALGPSATAIVLLAALTLGMGLVAPTIAAPSPAPTPHVISIPAHHVHVAAKHIHIPAKHVYVRGYDVNVPPVHVNVPGVHVHVPPVDVNVPGVNVNVPAIDVDVPEMHFDVPNPTANFRSASCTSACEFDKVNWPGRNLSGRSYSASSFSGAMLAGADFSHDVFNAVDFSKADLRNANFTDAKLEYVDFSHARLDGARFDGATLDVCDFSGVDMRSVDLSRAHLDSLCAMSLSHTSSSAPRHGESYLYLLAKAGYGNISASDVEELFDDGVPARHDIIRLRDDGF